ncbi:MAG: dTMP kinase [Clostridiales bacterium]|nr:dTMP kinase [Clostridiales bacterium]
MKGLFITFEGLDGCGKTTQIELLKKWLVDKGYDVVLTREPGGTQISERIRDIILDVSNDNMSYTCEMMLYAAARAQIIKEVIAPSLEKGCIVLCDRFVDSSYVYQGIARGLGVDVVERVNEIALDGVYPDVTLFFDISPKESKKRRAVATGEDRIEKEKLSFHEKVYQGYKYVAQMYPNRIKVIDAGGSVDKVHKEILACISKKISE